MEPEDLEDPLRRHEAMIEGLAKVWMRQSEMNERMDRTLARQDVLNERLISAIERLDKGAENHLCKISDGQLLTP